MLPAETPKLPKWPFLLGDALLLGTAWLIADQTHNPFTGQPLIWIVVCVVAAAIIGAVPFLSDYARRQDEALDERQRGLDAIARTVAASAEQISIAANGLHELTELAQRNLKAASQLGPGLEEKVAALKAELTTTRDDERADLRKEIAALRSADLGRVEAAALQLAKTVGEIIRAETALQKQISTVQELSSTAGDLAVTLNSAVEALQASRTTVPAAAPEAAAETPVPKPESKRARKVAPPAEAAETPADTPVPPVVIESAPTPAPVDSPPPPVDEPAPIAAVIETVIEPAPPAEPAATAEPPTETPAPVRKRAPRKPRTEPSSEPVLEIPAAAPAPADEPVAAAVAETPDEPHPSPAEEGGPAPETDEPAKAVEQSRSSDGATRLLVTAYVGIGNRLFIRGEGPGLTWEKGVPLQFVSIGKWRWETSGAAAPVKFKLYKNDDIECAALGTQALDPGVQQEVTATF